MILHTHILGYGRDKSMKTLTKNGKLLLVLTCLLYSGESVLLAGMAYQKGKVVEYAEAQSMKTMLGAYCWRLF